MSKVKTLAARASMTLDGDAVAHLQVSGGAFFGWSGGRGTLVHWPASLTAEELARTWDGASLDAFKPVKVVVTAECKGVWENFRESRPAAAQALVREMPSGSDAYFYAADGKVRLAEAQAVARTRVLIVDDSKTICDLLAKVLARDPSLEVVGTVMNPLEVEAAVVRLKPDVITMDIHMPHMTGVELLKVLLPKHPIPTIMISSVSMEDGTHVMNALQNGAVDYIQKPTLAELDSAIPVILEKVKNARNVKVNVGGSLLSIGRTPSRATGMASYGSWVIAIGSSTGGTEALRRMFHLFPDHIPPVLVVQHIPPVFSAALAKSLNDALPFEVREAKDGDEVKPNLVLIAPGGKQMELVGGNVMRVRVFEGPPVNRHKPSVDVLFDSVAKVHARRAIGVILTGMGNDGAKGLLRMRQAGSRTFGQDEASSVVYGMPKAAAQLGACEKVESLDRMAERLFECLKKASSSLAA